MISFYQLNFFTSPKSVKIKPRKKAKMRNATQRKNAYCVLLSNSFNWQLSCPLEGVSFWCAPAAQPRYTASTPYSEVPLHDEIVWVCMSCWRVMCLIWPVRRRCCRPRRAVCPPAGCPGREEKNDSAWRQWQLPQTTTHRRYRSSFEGLWRNKQRRVLFTSSKNSGPLTVYLNIKSLK